MSPTRALSLLPGLLLATTAFLWAEPPDRVVITAPAGPSAQEIVRRAVANDELRHQHRIGLVCDQLLTTERLDEAGTVFKTKTRHLIHREGTAFAVVVEGDMPPLERTHRDKDIDKAEHQMAVMNLRRLAPRFDCTLADEATARGRTCYVVAFSPRRGQRAGTTDQQAIDQLHGRFWIDQKTFEILQGEGSLSASVGVGPLASVRAMSFAFHTQTLPNGEAGPADFSVDFTVKAPFYFYRHRQNSQLEHWRPEGG